MQFNEWFMKRGISDEVLSDFHIHEGTHPVLGHCVVIPIEEGNFNKYRRAPGDERKPKYVYDTGGKASLFGWNKASSHKRILICEGELDALCAWSLGIPAVSSTGGAGTFKDEWGDLLKDKEVFVCYDNDAAGARGMVRLLEVIPHAQIILLPDNPQIKDITDYVTHGGDLVQLLTTAKHYSDETIEDDRATRIALFKSTFFHDAWLERKEENTKIEVTYKKPKNTTDIEQAKAYPISKLLRVSHGKAKCLWHSEKTASMHYYAASNSVYCFGCAKRADVIDVYRALHGCSFLQAVEDLKKL